MTPLEKAKAIAAVMDEMKAKDLKLIDIESISSLGDYFVIATGTSSTHVQSLTDKVELKLKEQGEMPIRIEGYRSTGWILMDYGSVVVHVFTSEAREFYDLDRLWGDGVEIKL